MAEFLSLSPDPESPGHARHFVTSWMQQWGYGSLVETAALLMSEMATNAVRHVGEPFTVGLEDTGHGVKMSVNDPAGAQLPSPRTPRALETGGRGLQIVAALADAWGAEVVPDDGKVVWCDLHVHP